MTYFESAEGITISRARALLEVRRHGASETEFIQDMGDTASYDAQAVLMWLGY